MDNPPIAANDGLGAYDYAAIVLYLLFTFGIAVWFSRRQKSTDTYFLGGRHMPWFAIGLSILATLLSTITYLGAPGEMVKHGIGLFIGYLAIPLSMTVVLFLWIPFFMRLRLTSAYEYLEHRFNYSTRLLASVLFVFLRLGWMSMVVYVASLALDQMKGADLEWLPGPDIYWWIALTGFGAALYTTLGGMSAMVWTDVVQFFLMLAGVVLTIGFVVYHTGTGPIDWFATAAEHSTGHTQIPFFSWDVTLRVTIVTAILHNFSWTICTHGSDQVVLQRYFSTPSVGTARRSYLINLLAEVTILSMLAVSGLALLAFYLNNPTLLPTGQAAARLGDKLFPYFLAHQLPAGCAGLIMAGFLCDALQTLEAGVNSTSAVIVTDMDERAEAKDRKRINGLLLARLVTVGLTSLVTLNAYLVAYVAREYDYTIIDLMPKAFNMFLGPLAALFFVGMFLPRCTARSVLPAALAGLTLSILWSWWKQIFGTDYTPTIFLAVALPCAFTFVLAAILGFLVESGTASKGREFTWWAVMKRPSGD